MGPVDSIEGANLLARIMTRPLKRQGFISGTLSCGVTDDRSVASKASPPDYLSSPAYPDLFLSTVHFNPLLSREIKLRIFGVNFLSIQIPIIADGRCNSPGDRSVVTEVDARRTWNRSAPNFIAISFIIGRDLKMH